MRFRGSQRKPGRDGRGQSLVEFTLVLPLFLLLVAGMVDFGMALYSNMTVINAAREGARLSVTLAGQHVRRRRAGPVDGLGPERRRHTVTTTCERPNPAPATTFSACTSPQWQPGDAVVVKVDYIYRMIWPLAIGNQIPMSSTVRMRIE